MSDQSETITAADFHQVDSTMTDEHHQQIEAALGSLNKAISDAEGRGLKMFIESHGRYVAEGRINVVMFNDDTRQVWTAEQDTR